MELTLRQKIGQLVLTSLDGNEITPEFRARVEKYHIGNIIHFGNNVTDFEGARALNRELNTLIQDHCGDIPPLIGIDHEGGRVMRFSKDFTWFPSQLALGAADDLQLSEEIGKAMGLELRAAGFNINFAPVVDVNSNAANVVIGARSFGDDPEQAALHGAAVCRGLQSAGVIACLKHFPGHGDTTQDSHFFLPTVDKTLDELRQTELIPYQRILSGGGADSVMTTHILFPRIEAEKLPATLSPTIIEGILRKELHFDGVVVTDGMQMLAIKEHYGVARGCVLAIKAGVDLLCVGTGGSGTQQGQQFCLDALYDAVVQGEIPMERIDEAVGRVLKAKSKYCASVPEILPDFEAHSRLNQTISRRAVTRIASGPVTGRLLFAGHPTKAPAYGLEHADPRRMTFEEIACNYAGHSAVSLELFDTAGDYDTLVIGAQSLQPNGPELSCAHKALSAGKNVAFILLGAPYDAIHVPPGCACLCCYSHTLQSVRAALDVLLGKVDALGKLPVRI
ncbi:MAG: glycoside hydrolase family 3 protein [Christensenellales bacterium]|nr:glycoside hydrolase family 3 protein [Christensenellales bacterium]